MPEQFTLDSTNLSGGSYDPETQELVIEFASGSAYAYEGVPAGVVQSLRSAASPGKFFYSAIREAYSYRRIG